MVPFYGIDPSSILGCVHFFGSPRPKLPALFRFSENHSLPIPTTLIDGWLNFANFVEGNTQHNIISVPANLMVRTKTHLAFCVLLWLWRHFFTDGATCLSSFALHSTFVVEVAILRPPQEPGHSPALCPARKPTSPSLRLLTSLVLGI